MSLSSAALLAWLSSTALTAQLSICLTAPNSGIKGT